MALAKTRSHLKPRTKPGPKQALEPGLHLNHDHGGTQLKPKPRLNLGLGPREEGEPATPEAIPANKCPSHSNLNEPLKLGLLDLPLRLIANLELKSRLLARQKACGHMGLTEMLLQSLDLKQCLGLEEDTKFVLQPPGRQLLVLEAVQKVGLQQELQQSSALKFGPNHFLKHRFMHGREADTVHHKDPLLSQNAVSQHIGSKDGRKQDLKLVLKLESNGSPKLEQKSVVNSGLHQEVNPNYRHKLGLKSRTLSKKCQKQGLKLAFSDCRKVEEKLAVNSEILQELKKRQKFPKPGLNPRTLALNDFSKVGDKLLQKLNRRQKVREPGLNPRTLMSNDSPKVEDKLLINSKLLQGLNQRPKDPKPGLNPRTFSHLPTNILLRSCRTFIFQFRPFARIFLLFLLILLVDFSFAGPPRPARPPLLSGQPFIVFWGLKDTSCSNRPDLRTFGIEPEGRVAVFYEDTLGNYPYFVDKDTAVNVGLPQHTKLDLHIQKTQRDVEAALPAPRYLGLGVVRWQEWAPQWSRSGDKQGLYVEATRKLMRGFFPDWTQQELERWSKVDFEASAQSLMTETLREVQRSRPKALWGFSPYPSCSNGTPTLTSLSNYSGGCPEDDRTLNDQLLWLWRRSTAIYPLLSIEKIQGGTPGAALYLSNQIRESLRVASLGGSADDLPVFPLVRSVYSSTNTFLSLSDLVSTVGESAALGAAGVIIWDRTETKTERECQDLGQFVRSVLGPYVSNVTAASRLCAASLCQGRGRCVRLDQNKPAFLHLQPPIKDEVPTDKPDLVNPTEQPSPALSPAPDPAEVWKKYFQCQWFSSQDGDVSDQASPKDGAPSVGSGEDVGRGLDVPATVYNVRTTTTGAYEGQSGENGGSVSAKTTLETPLDRGDGPSASKTIVLFLLLLVLCP